VQGGVGGLAAAVGATLWEKLGAGPQGTGPQGTGPQGTGPQGTGPQGTGRPRLFVVEPERADCLFQSAVHGTPTVVTGDLDTIMAGLACGEVSLLAWRVLEACAEGFLTIPDSAAVETMRRLARGTAARGTAGGDPPLVGGESGVAGLAGLLAACADGDLRGRLGLDAGSRVLVIGSEGATDPEVYARLVGRTPEEVAQERSISS
jgi:diaminopropionate ammonia-lyase